MPIRKQTTTYERWLRDEGVPVVGGHGVRDVRTMELGPWRRIGGRGAYIQLDGMEWLTGMYVAEIPPGGALEPEKHMYDELIYVLSGRGASAVWSANASQPESTFEWQTGSLFAPPLNASHRLMNTSGTEPARFLAVTTAPVVMDMFHNTDYVFNSEYVFADRFNGQPDFYEVGERRLHEAGVVVWETNFIPDVPATTLDSFDKTEAGVYGTCYEMAGNILVGHMAEWPAGRYHRAHKHGGGAILFIVRGQGYTLMWPSEYGIHPFEDGHGNKVVRIDWGEGSVFGPPGGWFHQHFNTGTVPAKQLALRYGSLKYGVGFHDIHAGEGVYVSVREGGAVIGYEDEDPEIPRQYREELSKMGLTYEMPEVAELLRV